ncbi:50S ribosomal protein L11 methyltransferase [uncultured Eudoraea sp.]|uniref:50S ribosomal protein L11 methyltransferase n=1 Tax=uncultured Eudoraea sp. TaxID=1035614 RepID=UPI002622E2B7|nr:50S ribosomal protein L11 methyltransferase [uncultured Eudoraea sp.]
MQERFLELKFTVHPLQPATDILMAELGEIGFDSFVETKEGMQAYIKKELWNPIDLKDVQILSNTDFSITYEVGEIAQANWNEQWEKNFDPILVDNQCMVRAPFHDRSDVDFDIVITPKMSFGTGHHETTHMMLKFILTLNIEGKNVLDMGCGTGVLAILASMKGAHSIDAIDIDNWSYLNALENVSGNSCDGITVLEGDAALLTNQSYDIILANINRNILLSDISIYSKHLVKGGILLLSGFYKEDLALISKECAAQGLSFQENLEKNNWVAAKYVF